MKTKLSIGTNCTILKNEIKHIYWFAPSNLSGPSTRYRGFFPLKYLENKNITNDFIFPERSIKGFFKFLKIYINILLFKKKTP